MKVIDITEKLNFEEKPKIRIKDIEITVNNSAVAMLKILSKMDGKDFSEIDISEFSEILNTLIPSKEDREKLEQLDLSFVGLITLVESAVSLVAGVNNAGEAQTRTTT